MPALTKSANYQTEKMWCTNVNCLKYSQAFIQLNPGISPTSAPCFNHVNLACPYQIAEDTGLTKQPGITSVDHAARIIKRKWREPLAKHAFGKQNRYNKSPGRRRDKDLDSELRAAQRKGGCFE